jgi:hypothetical protein
VGGGPQGLAGAYALAVVGRLDELIDPILAPLQDHLLATQAPHRVLQYEVGLNPEPRPDVHVCNKRTFHGLQLRLVAIQDIFNTHVEQGC